MTHKRGGLSHVERISSAATAWAGSTPALLTAVSVVVVWLVTGPFFRYSDTWQLVINTGTTVVTFIMVFLIQRSQNKESLALQLKLNELVAAVAGASNRLIDVEDLNEHELRALHVFYKHLAEISKKDEDLLRSRSVEDAS